MLVDELELDFLNAGICLACLTFVAAPLDLGHEREARREARRIAPDMWVEGLELAVMQALERARADGTAGADDAIEEVRQQAWRARVVQAILWRYAEQMVEDMRSRLVAK